MKASREGGGGSNPESISYTERTNIKDYLEGYSCNIFYVLFFPALAAAYRGLALYAAMQFPSRFNPAY